MNFFILGLGLFLICLNTSYGMTREQLKKTLSLMTQQCLPKIGVPASKVDKIEQGVFIEERDVMCYVACVYKSIQVVKNHKLNRDLIFKQVDAFFPQNMKAGFKKSVEKCMGVQDNYTDECEGIFYGIKCVYEDNPPNFVFP